MASGNRLQLAHEAREGLSRLLRRRQGPEERPDAIDDDEAHTCSSGHDASRFEDLFVLLLQIVGFEEEQRGKHRFELPLADLRETLDRHPVGVEEEHLGARERDAGAHLQAKVGLAHARLAVDEGQPIFWQASSEQAIEPVTPCAQRRCDLRVRSGVSVGIRLATTPVPGRGRPFIIPRGQASVSSRSSGATL